MAREELSITQKTLLTLTEADNLLSVADGTVRTLVNKKFIKALKLGCTKVRRAELDRFLAESEGLDFSDVIKGGANHAKTLSFG